LKENPKWIGSESKEQVYYVISIDRDRNILNVRKDPDHSDIFGKGDSFWIKKSTIPDYLFKENIYMGVISEEMLSKAKAEIEEIERSECQKLNLTEELTDGAITFALSGLEYYKHSRF